LIPQRINGILGVRVGDAPANGKIAAGSIFGMAVNGASGKDATGKGETRKT
jgi:hypothetical protein